MQRRGFARLVGVVAGVLLVGAVTACETGHYPADLFPEMHYQQAYRVQEPPYAQPPDGSVPVTGISASVDGAQAIALTNPFPYTGELIDRGAELFLANCSACHGPNADGKSYVAERFAQAGVRPPPDLHSDTIKNSGDGILYLIITNGTGNMPSFQRLLTSDERWTIIAYLRSIQ